MHEAPLAGAEMYTRSSARVLPVVYLALAALVGCSLTTEGELQTYTGEWCTLQGLGSSGFPRTGDRYVGMTLFNDGDVLSGYGSTKWPGSDTLYPSRFRGTVVGDHAIVEVTDLDSLAEAKGPVFTLELRIAGARDLEGTISGDDAMAGPITLVRLGPRCFYE
jgi:hypothetical protein